MSDTLKESLSALLDGETNDFELRRILSSDDQAVRQHWAELNRAQQLRRDGGVPYASLDISQRVMAELADEAFSNPGIGSWKQALSGMAVAASVAAVVVFGAMSSDMLSGSGSEPKLAAAANPSVGRVFPAQAAPAAGGVPVNAQLQTAVPVSRAAAEEEAQRRFEMYLRRHTDRAALNSGQGIMSYTRVVAPESR